MSRRLFCELSPLAYNISVFKCCTERRIKDFFSGERFAREKCGEKLPVVIYKHNSLIRRTLGNTQPQLQENKAVNLALTAPKINGILIKPGETFSFWHLAGRLTEKKGYKEGLMISNARSVSGIGGGMCQFTNLIHWMVMHSPLDITEHTTTTDLTCSPTLTDKCRSEREHQSCTTTSTTASRTTRTTPISS